MKIAITTSSFGRYSREPLEILDRAGLDYALNPHGRKLTETEVTDILAGCTGVVAGTEPLTSAVIGALPSLRVISRCGVGLDNVDMSCAQKQGISVHITPNGPTLAVAELTLGLALNLLRRVSVMDRELRSGTWRKRMGYTLSGKRLGIVGLGRIGQAVANLFSSLDVFIAFTDPVVDDDRYERKELGSLLEWADIITLHCSMPKGETTLIDEKALARMRPDAWIINCGRGNIVEEGALHAALKSGKLAGAAVDVFHSEPYSGPLLELDNVILTPHIGSYARESRIQMEIDAVKNLIVALQAE
ncbi:MAG: phosphoglycerate dehydrogenase [Desulfobacterales bacterium]|nr:phosphoglycerate dehydrogenase [Desulfobacterales bacterium]